MKRLIFCLALLLSATAQATIWVANNRTTVGGAGTSGNPWDIQTALSQAPGVVAPGDTINLNGGVYCFPSQVRLALQGSVGSRITVQSTPGQWAVINRCSTYGILTDGTPRPAFYTDFRDMEFIDTATSRNPFDEHMFFISANVGVHDIRIINNVLHDPPNGSPIIYGPTSGSTPGFSELQGNVVYYGGGPSTSNKYHNVYLRPSPGNSQQVIIKNNIFFDAMSADQSLASEFVNPTNPIHKAPLMTGNIIFLSGQIRTPAPVQSTNIETNGDGILLDSNLIYPVGGFSGGGTQLGKDDHGCNGDAVLTNNFIVGKVFWMNCIPGITMTGNKFYANSGVKWTTQTAWNSTPTPLATSSFPANEWDLSQPVVPWILVRTNDYDSTRGTIGIINWNGAGSVNVDISSIVQGGHNWMLFWAGNYTGKLTSTPVQTGTNYLGGTVPITMSAYTMATPVTLATPPSLGPTLGAFIIFDTGASGGPTATPSNTPTTTFTSTNTSTPTQTPTSSPTITAGGPTLTPTLTPTRTPTIPAGYCKRRIWCNQKIYTVLVACTDVGHYAPCPWF